MAAFRERLALTAFDLFFRLFVFPFSLLLLAHEIRPNNKQMMTGLALIFLID